MPLVGNYIKLEIGKLDIIAFDRAVKQTKEIEDPVLGFPKEITTLDLHVTELNGEPVNTVFSITSQVLIAQLEPYLVGQKYLVHRFTFTQTPGKYQPPRLVSVTTR